MLGGVADTRTDPASAPGTGPSRARGRSAAVWEVLQAALAPLGAPLAVVDAGGGTGSFAVPLAALGHRVTVVDPSPDSLAALERRAAERGCPDRVRGVQGDLGDLVALAGGADVVVCHNVLEVVEDPAAALAAVRAVLRPDGLVSVVVANRSAAVLARAMAGRLTEALHVLTGSNGPEGSRRRFAAGEIRALLDAAGFTVHGLYNVRVFTDVVPGSLLDADPGAPAALAALEREAAGREEFTGLAAQLHLLARRRS